MIKNSHAKVPGLTHVNGCGHNLTCTLCLVQKMSTSDDELLATDNELTDHSIESDEPHYKFSEYEGDKTKLLEDFPEQLYIIHLTGQRNGHSLCV